MIQEEWPEWPTIAVIMIGDKLAWRGPLPEIPTAQMKPDERFETIRGGHTIAYFLPAGAVLLPTEEPTGQAVERVVREVIDHLSKGNIGKGARNSIRDGLDRADRDDTTRGAIGRAIQGGR